MQFAEAVSRVVRRGGAGWREQLIRLFERKAPQLESKDSLVARLTRMGVTGYEAEMIAQEIAPSDLPPGFSQPGQQPVMATTPTPASRCR